MGLWEGCEKHGSYPARSKMASQREAQGHLYARAPLICLMTAKVVNLQMSSNWDIDEMPEADACKRMPL